MTIPVLVASPFHTVPVFLYMSETPVAFAMTLYDCTKFLRENNTEGISIGQGRVLTYWPSRGLSSTPSVLPLLPCWGSNLILLYRIAVRL